MHYPIIRWYTYLLLYELFCLVIEDGSEAMLVQGGLWIQTEIKADVNGGQFIPKFFLGLKERKKQLH